MASRIEQIIEEIEEYIDGCKYQALSSSKIIVNKDELEELLNKNDFIEESLVTGDFNEVHDDTEVTALIVPNMDIIKKKIKKPTKEDIANIINSAIKTINEKLPNFKHIKNVSIRDKEFEKTTTQKIKRFGSNLEHNTDEKNKK